MSDQETEEEKNETTLQPEPPLNGEEPVGPVRKFMGLVGLAIVLIAPGVSSKMDEQVKKDLATKHPPVAQQSEFCTAAKSQQRRVVYANGQSVTLTC